MIYLLVVFFLVSPVLVSADFSGLVVQVYDGDTITVEVEEQGQPKKKKIRLLGVDAPEKSQAYGKHSQQFVKTLVQGKYVTIREQGKDRYNRILGQVFLQDGRSLNQELVKAGLAWWYYQYSDSRTLAQLELEARLAHVGVWQGKNPVPPWVYRKVKDLLR